MSTLKTKKSYKELLITLGPAILLTIAGFWVAYQFVAPPPPKKISITTGSQAGTYFKLAQQYKSELAKEGIELEIITSSGSKQNIERLLNKQADVAFIQGGTGNNEPSLQSLGSLYYEPLWIFVKKEIKAERITDFIGLRVAYGAEGSGTRVLTNKLLSLNNLDAQSTQFLALSSTEAAKALINDQCDVVFIVASGESNIIHQLLHNERIKLIQLSRIDAYTRLLPYLSKITLPEGIVDLEQNLPPQPVNMLSPTANLVVNEDFNSALTVLLLRAADVVHKKTSLFSAAETFPSSQFIAYPINDVAKRFYKVGSPFLMRYLPFWPAVFIDRMIVMLIPLLALIIPLGKIMPPLYRWRIRSKIYRWYKELQEADDTMHEPRLTSDQIKQLNNDLLQIQNEVNKVKTPLSYADQVYNLLLHIDLVKKNLNAIEIDEQ
ncbi:MAG: TAXI family TRAP transporter solute-binding subunit [Methylococcales bacterium]